MRRRGLLPLLDPFGPLNPLHPRNPLSPFRSAAATYKHPPIELTEEHDSLLAKLYGKGALQSLPFPNMEWWWNAIECTSPDRQEHFSILTNVHLFALPDGGWSAQGTVAIRDLVTKRSWQTTSSGTLDPNRSSRFTASGWHLYRDWQKNSYEIDVVADDIELKLSIPQGKVAHFDDLPEHSLVNRRDWGWFNNNPGGNIPYWASYRSRFTSGEETDHRSGKKRTIRGDLRLPDRSEREIGGGTARFDHQSLHWSVKDAGGLTVGVLGEALVTRPCWLWYHVRLTVAGQPLNLVAYELRNGHTGTVLKRAAALSDDSGMVSAIDPDTLVFTPGTRLIAGRVPAPRRMTIEFGRNSMVRGKLHFTCKEDQGWTVRYPITGSLAYEAQEVLGTISGEIQWHGERQAVSGTGTLEVLDLLSSIST